MSNGQTVEDVVIGLVAAWAARPRGTRGAELDSPLLVLHFCCELGICANDALTVSFATRRWLSRDEVATRPWDWSVNSQAPLHTILDQIKLPDMDRDEKQYTVSSHRNLSSGGFCRVWSVIVGPHCSRAMHLDCFRDHLGVTSYFGTHWRIQPSALLRTTTIALEHNRIHYFIQSKSSGVSGKAMWIPHKPP